MSIATADNDKGGGGAADGIGKRNDSTVSIDDLIDLDEEVADHKRMILPELKA